MSRASLKERYIVTSYPTENSYSITYYGTKQDAFEMAHVKANSTIKPVVIVDTMARQGAKGCWTINK